MTADQAKWLRFYDRGVITRYELTFRLVATTQACPIADFVAHLPEEVLELVRSAATGSAEFKWIVIADYCARDISGWRSTKHEQEQLWLQGLAHWRVYFESTTT